MFLIALPCLWLFSFLGLSVSLSLSLPRLSEFLSFSFFTVFYLPCFFPPFFPFFFVSMFLCVCYWSFYFPAVWELQLIQIHSNIRYCQLFNFSYSSGCIWFALWCKIAFFWWLMMLDIFHVLIDHSYTFFDKMPIQIFCPFLLGCLITKLLYFLLCFGFESFYEYKFFKCFLSVHGLPF